MNWYTIWGLWVFVAIVSLILYRLGTIPNGLALAVLISVPVLFVWEKI